VRTVLLVTPTIFSALLMAAHFLRYWDMALVLIFVWLPLLLLVKRAWAARILQLAMVLAALVWGRLTWTLVHERLAEGEEWVRLALILGAVALLAIVAALLFETRRLRRRYCLRTASWFEA
jgi:hypothetical protein